jgi:hypothetical protein
MENSREKRKMLVKTQMCLGGTNCNFLRAAGFVCVLCPHCDRVETLFQLWSRVFERPERG